MTAEQRKSKAQDETKTKKKEENAEQSDEQPPVPLLVRVLMIAITSFFAEKIWRNRTIISDQWYSDRQTPTEKAMISAFEYIVAMGMLFFMGIIISKVTILLQPKRRTE